MLMNKYTQPTTTEDKDHSFPYADLHQVAYTQ